jgi:hypothetical protein
MSKKTEQAKEATTSAMATSDKAWESGEEKGHRKAVVAHKAAIDAHDAANGEHVMNSDRISASYHEQMAAHHINMIKAHNSALDGSGHGGRAKEDFERARGWMKETQTRKDEADKKA